MNRNCVGAVVRVYPPGKLGQADALLCHREIAVGYGYASGQEAIAHVGLGPLDSCDLEILLPHGRGRMEQTGVKAYRILAEALRERGRVGIAQVALREKQHLATLRAQDGVLILETMHWPDEIRTAQFEELEQDVEVRPEELQMAEMIIDNLTSAFDPEQWHDRTRENVEELAHKKIEGQEIVAPELPEPTKVVDLLEALKASVEATRAKRAAAG